MAAEGEANYHLGNMFFDGLKQKKPDDICQIDAATGERETYASVLARSVRAARALRRRGMRAGDVLALGGRNHVHLRIPYYAALMNGLPVVGVDPLFKYDEIKVLFETTSPKIAFCENETFGIYQKAANDLKMDLHIVTFDDGEYAFSKFLEEVDEEPIGDFQPAEVDTEKVYAWLVSTSGSTGIPKVAAIKHGVIQMCVKAIEEMNLMAKPVDGKQKLSVNLSPVQWISGYFFSLGMPLLNTTMLQTSNNDVDNILDMINNYRPSVITGSPSIFARILNSKKECDWTCFDTINMAGDKCYKETIIELRSKVRKGARVLEFYGQTETLTPLMMPSPDTPVGSCGRLLPLFQVKLVDPDTEQEITEPNQTGELWTKGPAFSVCTQIAFYRFLIQEYYNNPEETKRAFAPGGWYRTGDLLYRDEDQNYYFVDRVKMLIKYRNIQVHPPEIEEVIASHPGVLEVGVTGVPNQQDGHRPVACVVRRPGHFVTAQEIKDLVADKLSDSKHLRGGVVFMEALPKTSTAKLARAALKKFVLTAHTE